MAQQPIQWLSRDSFTAEINLPESLEVADLAPYTARAVRQHLMPLLGTGFPAFQAWVIANAPVSLGDVVADENYNIKLYRLVEPYLVYLSWANYILEGGITATDTGLVEKARAFSNTITDVHRAELRRSYSAMAAQQSLLISNFIATETSCIPAHRPGVQFGKAEGRKQSLFDQKRSFSRDSTLDLSLNPGYRS